MFSAYFKSLTTSARELGAFQGNMYLAEDRILCFELIARKGEAWTMHYVKVRSAITTTGWAAQVIVRISSQRALP